MWEPKSPSLLCPGGHTGVAAIHVTIMGAIAGQERPCLAFIFTRAQEGSV